MAPNPQNRSLFPACICEGELIRIYQNSLKIKKHYIVYVDNFLYIYRSGPVDWVKDTPCAFVYLDFIKMWIQENPKLSFCLLPLPEKANALKYVKVRGSRKGKEKSKQHEGVKIMVFENLLFKAESR